MAIPINVIKSVKDIIIEVHDTIINVSGGEKGVRDDGGLEHAIYSILNIKNKQDKPIYVAAKTYNLFATRHYFFDGNKRTAHISAKVLLFILGLIHLKVHYKDAVKFIIEIADKKKTIKDIEKWIESKSEDISDINKIEGYFKDLEDDMKEIKEYMEKN